LVGGGIISHTFSPSDSSTGPSNGRECAIEGEDSETFVSLRVRFGSEMRRASAMLIYVNNLENCSQLMDLLYSSVLL
jgi:hypothetical protein